MALLAFIDVEHGRERIDRHGRGGFRRRRGRGALRPAPTFRQRAAGTHCNAECVLRLARLGNAEAGIITMGGPALTAGKQRAENNSERKQTVVDTNQGGLDQ